MLGPPRAEPEHRVRGNQSGALGDPVHTAGKQQRLQSPPPKARTHNQRNQATFYLKLAGEVVNVALDWFWLDLALLSSSVYIKVAPIRVLY